MGHRLNFNEEQLKRIIERHQKINKENVEEIDHLCKIISDMRSNDEDTKLEKLCREYKGQYIPGDPWGDKVEHPSYYNQGIEAIDYIESHKMNFNLGNVIKYVTRCEHKDNKVEDLNKAIWYIQREIDKGD